MALRSACRRRLWSSTRFSRSYYFFSFFHFPPLRIYHPPPRSHGRKWTIKNADEEEEAGVIDFHLFFLLKKLLSYSFACMCMYTTRGGIIFRREWVDTPAGNIASSGSFNLGCQMRVLFHRRHPAVIKSASWPTSLQFIDIIIQVDSKVFLLSLVRSFVEAMFSFSVPFLFLGKQIVRPPSRGALFFLLCFVCGFEVTSATGSSSWCSCSHCIIQPENWFLLKRFVDGQDQEMLQSNFYNPFFRSRKLKSPSLLFSTPFSVD